MSTATLKKINTRAKQIRKAHPGKSWKAAQKQAGKEVSKGKVRSSRPKKAKRKKVGKVAHHKPRVRKPAKYYAREVHEVRRVGAIRYTGGKVSISGTANAEAAKRNLRAALGEQAGWLDVAISSAKTMREKKALRKKKRQVISELNRIK